MQTIKVHIVKYPDRANLMMRYFDPLTLRQIARSTNTPKLADARRAAAKWEFELQQGLGGMPSRMKWEDFRSHYVSNAIAGLADNSVLAYESTFNAIERACNLQRLSDVTTQRVTMFVKDLRERKLSEATIARHLRHLKAAMRWAHRESLLPILPQFTMPKRIRGSKLMRGRPITAEEFERILKVVPKVVDNVAAPSWTFYLKALWESGLRLSESLTLRWDDAPGAIVVDLDGRRPMLRIPAEAEKANRDRLLPITPEFAAVLLSVPERQRRGRVFKLVDVDGKPFQVKRWPVGRIVSAIGEAAGVVVDEREVDGETIRKFASAHDLRRAFGQRWSQRVMPTVLRELMRHASINTTMGYYVGNNAEATADILWAAVPGNNSGNTRPTRKQKPQKHSTFPVDGAGIEPATPGFSVLCSTN